MNPTRRSLLATGAGLATATGLGLLCTPAVAAPRATPDTLARLVHPSRKYLGLALQGAPESVTGLDRFSADIGKDVNLVEYYVAFGDQYQPDRTRNAWQRGALTLITWEPWTPSLRAIAVGESDAYVTAFATSVRDAGLPVAISFGHELNGTWYPWGAQNPPGDFVAAYQRVHDIFARVGASNVIWAWVSNAITGTAGEAAARYPGDDCVDWVGLVRYIYPQETFAGDYQASIDIVRTFTGCPVLVTEIGFGHAGPSTPPAATRAHSVASALAAIADHPEVIGFVQFEYDASNKKGREDWRIAVDPPALAAFRQGIADPRYGFDVRRV